MRHCAAAAQAGEAFGRQQASENPTGLERQHCAQGALQSGRERLGLTGEALAERHRHCHGSMGTQSEGLGLAPGAHQRPRQRATDAAR